MEIQEYINTIDTHTEGQPTRIITSLKSKIQGKNLVDKMNFFKKNFDYIRTALMAEPRGHKDMYGCILTEPVSKESDYGIIFMDNLGYMSMCGHGVIGVATALTEQKLVGIEEPITRIGLDTPAGLVEVNVTMKNGHAESVRFMNVPAFIEYLDVDLEVQDLGKLKVDVVFGGNYFVFYSADEVGLEITPQNIEEIIDIAMKVMKSANQQLPVQHPELKHHNKINISTIIGKPKNPKANYLNVHVWGTRQFDRSPGGTATCARMAALHAKGQLDVNEEIWVESLTGGLFKGRILELTKVGTKNAIIPEVTGTAHITGLHQFVIEPDDSLKRGFLINDSTFPSK